MVKLKPDIILFLVGCNDVGIEDLGRYDKGFYSRARYRYIKLSGKLRSEVADFFINLSRVLKAQRRQLEHESLDITKSDVLEVSGEKRQRHLQKHRMRYLEGYRKRLLTLIIMTRRNGIEPVFITQPTLWGDEVDSVTGVYLGTLSAPFSLNGKTYWEVLELYNDVTRSLARIANVLVIDLARKMPKSSLYFYDAFHYTNEGAEKVADILYRELKGYLDERYSSYIRD